MIEVNKSQLIKGNCLDIIELLADNSIDICLTDPPYGIDYQSNRNCNEKTQGIKFAKIQNDLESFTDWIKPIYSKLKNGGRLICFYRWDVQDAFLNEIKEAGFLVKSQIIWDKGVHGMGDLAGEFAPQHESIIYATKGRYEFKGKRPTTIIRANRLSPTHMIHPNEKPLSLIKHILLSISEPNEVVFDPFAGSASTYQACVETGRICITTELDDHYFSVAKDRISKIKSFTSNFF